MTGRGQAFHVASLLSKTWQEFIALSHLTWQPWGQTKILSSLIPALASEDILNKLQ